MLMIYKLYGVQRVNVFLLIWKKNNIIEKLNKKTYII